MGSNEDGKLGLGDKSVVRSPVPQLLETFLDQPIDMVSCGDHHTLALTQKVGQVYSWGLGINGALALNSAFNRMSPTLVTDLTQNKIRCISAGSKHSLFVTTDGLVYSSGENDKGQLGLGTYSKEVTAKQV